MRLFFYCLLTVLVACGGPQNQKRRPGEAYVIKETIATGDTGMLNLSGFRKKDMRDILCQRWEVSKLEGGNSSELLNDQGQQVLPEMNIFKDGSVIENPRYNLQIGSWQLTVLDTLQMTFGTTTRKYAIITLNAKSLRLVHTDESGKKLFLNLSSDAFVHRNMYNDPFHPSNNRWRIKPLSTENDSAIKQRAVDCIKFYALFYRDVLKRPHKRSIDFGGLPKVYIWYSGGIGLPRTNTQDTSWVNCFFNEEQARKGHELLRKLIVKYEYDWPKDVAWSSQTHSVLEQMYHKAKGL